MTPETIVGVAIEVTPGRVFTLPRPYRHHHVIRVAADLGEKTPIIGEQGFVTSTGRFVDRKEAGRIADANGQANRTVGSHEGGDLYSEDLW